MSSETYNVKALVLKKTRLGESDLIITLLAQDGSQKRAVAKGARKPKSSFSARLDLYSEVDLLVNVGKSLDIVREARLLDAHEQLKVDIVYATAAAPIVELLDRTTQQDLELPRLYDLTKAALDTLCVVREDKTIAITAAHLLKTFAFLGLRPHLFNCVICGNEVEIQNRGGRVGFSYSEGGLVCDSCGHDSSTQLLSAELCRWMAVLLKSTFEEIVASDITKETAFEILRFCQVWSQHHVGSRLKSLDFIFTSGIYAQ